MRRRLSEPQRRIPRSLASDYKAQNLGGVLRDDFNRVVSPDYGGDIMSEITVESKLENLAQLVAQLIKNQEPQKPIDDEKFWNNPNELLIKGLYEYELSETASRLFTKMNNSGLYFYQGESIVKATKEGLIRECEQSLRTTVSEFFKLIHSVNTDATGKFFKKKANLTTDISKAIIHCKDKSPLKEISIISQCPVLYVDECGDVQVCYGGFTDASGVGIFVTGGDSVEPETIQEAVCIINGIFYDFDFLTPADRARAIAMIITPAMMQAGLLKDGPIPMDFGEADQSQAGKGYRHDLNAATYNDEALAISNRKKGVGSFDESFGSAIVQGRTFIRMDNLRDELDSEVLESYITTRFSGSFLARSFKRSEYVHGGRNILQASSNGAQGTQDIANRSCIIRILKRPEGYQFMQFHEGGILQHVEANQGKFLGAIHKVIREWVKSKCPGSRENRHDFTNWVRKLDWILEHYFGMPGMMDGHRDIQMRVASETASLLRTVALDLEKADRLDEELSAAELVEIIESAGIELKGKEGEKHKGLGIQFAKVFKERNSEEITIDRFKFSRVLRMENRTSVSSHGGKIEKKYYRFSLS